MFASSTFGITGDVLRNIWVGGAFTSKSPATALKICVSRQWQEIDWGVHTLDRMLYLWWYEIELLVWPSKQMVCFRRLRILSRDKRGASDFLAFSNFNHTLDKGPITERVLSCIFPRISSTAKEFLFFSFNRSLNSSSIFLTWFKLFGTECIHRLHREYFSMGCISQTVCLH